MKENNEITENILWASENANYRGKVSETTYHPMSAPYKKDVGSGLNIVILSKVTFLTTSSISRSTTYSPVDQVWIFLALLTQNRKNCSSHFPGMGVFSCISFL